MTEPTEHYEAVIVARFLMGLTRADAHGKIDNALRDLYSRRDVKKADIIRAVHAAIDAAGLDVATAALTHTRWDGLLGDLILEGQRGVLIEFKASWEERTSELKKVARRTLVWELNNVHTDRQGTADRCHWFVYGPTTAEADYAQLTSARDYPFVLTRCAPYRQVWSKDAESMADKQPHDAVDATRFIAGFLSSDGEIGADLEKFESYLSIVTNGSAADDEGFALALRVEDGKLSMALRQPGQAYTSLTEQPPGRSVDIDPQLPVVTTKVDAKKPSGPKQGR